MILPPPQPGRVSLASLFTDPSQSYAREIDDASAARALVRSVLKANRKDALAAGTGDWTAALKVHTLLLLLLLLLRCGVTRLA